MGSEKFTPISPRTKWVPTKPFPAPIPGQQTRERPHPGGTMPTILALFDDLNPEDLSRLLPPEWRFVTVDQVLQAGRVDVLVLDGRHNSDKRLYGIKTGLKSRVVCPQLTNKIELHELVQGEEITPSSWTITRWDAGGARIADHRPHMWRPEGGWKGKGVAVITTQEELDRRRRNLEGYDLEEEEDYDRAVLSEYITHPLLLDGRKLNVRLYLIVATHRRGAALLHRGLIGVAKDPYVCGKFDNMRIHDSRTLIHRDYRFPDDYPGGALAAADFFEQAKDLFGEVVRRASIRSYDESAHGFEVLGCDLMVDVRNAPRVYLIEINHKPGHQQLDPRNQQWLSRVVTEGMVQFGMGISTPGISHQYARVGMEE